MKRKEQGYLINKKVKMDTQTVYHANGDVNIFPCSYEMPRLPIVTDAVTHRGRMTLQTDGVGLFKAYQEGGGTRYEKLFATESGELYSTSKAIYAKVKLPADMSACRMAESLMKQLSEICEYIQKNL